MQRGQSGHWCFGAFSIGLASIRLGQAAKMSNKNHKNIIRVIVSMGAVGAIAPMVYEGVGAGTHGFCYLLSQFHQTI